MSNTRWHNLVSICVCVQNTLYYDTWWVGQHVGLVWISAFFLFAAHYLPAKYLDVFHRSALHLGRWIKVEGRHAHVPYTAFVFTVFLLSSNLWGSDPVPVTQLIASKVLWENSVVDLRWTENFLFLITFHEVRRSFSALAPTGFTLCLLASQPSRCSICTSSFLNYWNCK